MVWRLLILLLVVSILASCESDDSTGPKRTLEGAWDLVGYSDHGVSGVTTGTASFEQDGTFTILGTVTYPGEPVDSLDVSGTYELTDTTVKLMTADGEGLWFTSYTGDQVVLYHIGSDPPTTMTLKRR